MIGTYDLTPRRLGSARLADSVHLPQTPRIVNFTGIRGGCGARLWRCSAASHARRGRPERAHSAPASRSAT